jgi:hypothetical protein
MEQLCAVGSIRASGAKALNQILSVPPDQNSSSLKASEGEVPEQDAVALLAHLKANSERLLAALEAAAIQAKPAPWSIAFYNSLAASR